MTVHPPQVVSAIIPARNEELNVACSVRSIAAQPEISEIVVVDDQSEDRTGEILQELEEEFPQLRAVRVDMLPEGWLGKPHALAAGARLAAGEWLLFTDADTVHKAGSLGALLARAQDERAALLSISPGQRLETWWEKSVMPLIFTQLAVLYPFERVSDPGAPTAAANGQYILIRRAVYESVGGHAAAPGAMLEDVDLARRVKSAGGRLVFLPGAEWAETRMYRSFAEMWQGWTKNLFLLYQRDEDAIRHAIFGLLGRWCVAVALVAFSAVFISFFLLFPSWRSPWPVLIAITPLSLLAMQQRRLCQSLRRASFSPRLAKYFLLGAPLLSLLLLHSAWAYGRCGRVQWKGRTYSVVQPQ